MHLLSNYLCPHFVTLPKLPQNVDALRCGRCEFVEVMSLRPIFGIVPQALPVKSISPYYAILRCYAGVKGP